MKNTHRHNSILKYKSFNSRVQWSGGQPVPQPDDDCGGFQGKVSSFSSLSPNKPTSQFISALSHSNSPPCLMEQEFL